MELKDIMRKRRIKWERGRIKWERNEKKKKISHKLITFSSSRSLPVSVCI